MYHKNIVLILFLPFFFKLFAKVKTIHPSRNYKNRQWVRFSLDLGCSLMVPEQENEVNNETIPYWQYVSSPPSLEMVLHGMWAKQLLESLWLVAHSACVIPWLTQTWSWFPFPLPASLFHLAPICDLGRQYRTVQTLGTLHLTWET